MEEGGIYTGKGNLGRRMGRALLEHWEQEVAHSTFMLCFRENIFLIFEEFLGKERRSRSDQRRRREEIVEAKGEKGERRGRRNRFFFLRREYIFHLQDDARDGNNHDYGSKQQREIGIKNREDDGEKEDTSEICYERAKGRRSGIAEEDFQHRPSSTSRRYRESNDKVARDAYVGESLHSIVKCDPLVYINTARQD